MTPSVGIGCIVLREHAETPVLLLRRAFGQFLDEWGFVGGTVEPGELLDATAARELFEETGIRAVPRKLSVILHAEMGVEIHVFLAEISETPEIVLDSENSESGWFSFLDAERLLPLAAQKNALNIARNARSIEST